LSTHWAAAGAPRNCRNSNQCSIVLPRLDFQTWEFAIQGKNG
jgi:hypothetical protein